MQELNATIDSISGTYGEVQVFHAHLTGGKRVRMVGAKDSIFNPGEYRCFTGAWEVYKNAGTQFRVKNSTLKNVTDEMINSFLVNQTGIGKETVKSLLNTFGNQLPKLLDEADPKALMQAPKVGQAIALQAIHAWHEQGAKTELIDYITVPLTKHPALVNKLTSSVLKAHEFYKHTTLDKLKEDPYRLWAFCSFKDTDRLALALGVEKDDRRRLLCAFEEALYQLYCEGHTAVPPDMVNETLNGILGGEYHCEAIYQAARNDDMKTSRFIIRDNGRWSLPSAYIMEIYVRKELVDRTGNALCNQLSMFGENAAAGYLLPGNNPLDASQEEAVNAILQHDVVAVVGEAGTGKTSVLYAANDLLHRTGRQVLQVALSGKASQRLIQQTEQEAYTIETMLGKIDKSPRFLDAYDMPVLFVDEASMVDLPLMYRVLKAFEDRPLKIVFIGDFGQLPPIGSGLVFHRLIESDRFPVVQLTTNYRTLAGSTIPSAASDIREGKTFTTSKDVFLIERNSDDVSELAIEQYLQNHQYDSIQIISATKRVMATVNRRLQNKLLKDAPVVKKSPEFRIGDKVIYKKNDKHLGLVNGSMGVIVESLGDVVVINKETNETVPADMVIDFKNEGRVPLLLSQIKSKHDGEWYVQHAYAVTCHQGQGSEFDCVIIALEQTRLLDRSWLYTAATRSKQKLIFVGNAKLIQQAIDSGNSADNRQVGLSF